MLIIQCPACAASLRLPRAVLARKARRICCAVCEHRWMEAPIPLADVEPAAAPTLEAPAAPEISLLAESGRSRSTPAPAAEAGMRARAAARARKIPQELASASRRILPRLVPRRLSHRAAACAAVLLLMFAVMKRDVIVRAAPPLAGAYAAIGLPVNLLGLQWRDVKTSVMVESSQRILAVEGEIKNLRQQTQNVPDIQISLRDDDGREVYRWTTPAPKSNLGQNETIQFRARLASPPDSARALRVHFAEAGER
jgi:predicted Zn finger-like uncharacterized protein